MILSLKLGRTTLSIFIGGLITASFKTQTNFRVASDLCSLGSKGSDGGWQAGVLKSAVILNIHEEAMRL